MSEQTGNQKLYKIRIYKDFEFPSFSINQENTLLDLYDKSLEEVHDNLKTEDYFELEVTQTLPFTLKREEEPNKMKSSLKFFIKEVAIRDLETKYGELDYEKNPSIYDKRTRNNGRGADADSPYYLKTEVEDYFSMKVNYYSEIFLNRNI